jgi:hypothetical protein
MQLFQKAIDVPHEYREHSQLFYPEGDDFVLFDGFDEGALKLFQGSFVLLF